LEDAEKRLGLQEEKEALRNKLLDIPKMKARLAELKEVASNSSLE
jgi:ATP-binding cassette subfamily D (ALD) long-chain fatty acid import protein